MKIKYSIGNNIVEKDINGLKLQLTSAKGSEILQELKRLKENKEYVHSISTKDTIDLLDRCAKLWLDKEYAKKHIDILSKITNQSPELVSYELEGCMSMLLKENLERTIVEELENINMLDKWIETSYGHVHRQPRGLAFHNISGNAFVVIPMSLAMGLLSKNCNLVKVSGDEPYFANAVYESLYQLDNSISERLSIMYFDSSQSDIYEEIVKESNCVIHWGGEYSGKIMSNLCAKYDSHLIMHGAKVSFEVIDEIDNYNELAKDIAGDITVWEQKACLSPRIVFVNKKLEVEKLASHMADSLKTLSYIFPKAYMDPWNSMKTIQDRQYCALKYCNDEVSKAYYSYNADYTVILSETMPTKEDLDRCFYRFVFVCPYEDEKEVHSYIKENIQGYLQTMGYCGHNNEFIEMMTLLGVSIVTKPGEMSRHLPGSSHDGLHNLTEMTYVVSKQL